MGAGGSVTYQYDLQKHVENKMIYEKGVSLAVNYPIFLYIYSVLRCVLSICQWEYKTHWTSCASPLLLFCRDQHGGQGRVCMVHDWGSIHL